MKTEELMLWYQYNYWANRRIVTTCGNISPEQYIAHTNFGIGYQSLRATLVHILESEWSWRLICQGVPVTKELVTEADLPTLKDLEELWEAEQTEMQGYIGTLSDENLDSIIRYPLDSGTIRERVLWHCLLHVVNHGTQHRSEAGALLTSYGQSPGNLDFTLFLNQYYNLPS